MSDSGLPAPQGNSASGSRPSGYGREGAPGSKLRNVRAGRSPTATRTRTRHRARHSPPHPPAHFTEIPSACSHEALTPSRPGRAHPPEQTLGHPTCTRCVRPGWGHAPWWSSVPLCPPCTRPTGPEATGTGVALALVCAVVFFPTALLTTRSSSRLSLESSALCVDSAARMPRPSVTPLSFSPSVGGT